MNIYMVKIGNNLFTKSMITFKVNNEMTTDYSAICMSY